MLAAKFDQLEPALTARPNDAGGTLRIRRRGDWFHFAYRDEKAEDWFEMGEVEAKVSPEVQLWLTAHKTGKVSSG